jgi:hypothetical protein
MKRLISEKDLREFSKDYLYSNINSEMGRYLIADSVLDKFDFEGAVEVANDEQYSIEVVEEELKLTLRRGVGVALIVSGFGFAE